MLVLGNVKIGKALPQVPLLRWDADFTGMIIAIMKAAEGLA